MSVVERMKVDNIFDVNFVLKKEWENQNEAEDEAANGWLERNNWNRKKLQRSEAIIVYFNLNIETQRNVFKSSL